MNMHITLEMEHFPPSSVRIYDQCLHFLLQELCKDDANFKQFRTETNRLNAQASCPCPILVPGCNVPWPEHAASQIVCRS